MPVRFRAPLNPSLLCATVILALGGAPAAHAQSVNPDDLAALRQEVLSLRVEQERAAERIALLETALARAQSAIPEAPAPERPTVAIPASSPVSTASTPQRRLVLQGDLRLRYENNFSDEDGRDRERGVLRARLRGAYGVNHWLTIGGQIATGDPDDPNSSDTTLTGYDDDLNVSLDQAFMRAQFGGLTVQGGKIPQPFIRTDLVWDGDVSPEGISAAYVKTLSGGLVLKASSLYFIVDEAVGGPDSTMVGGQVGFDTGAARPWRFELAGGYFDYTLGSVAGADAGDFRGNLLTPAGRYLSDFDLVDVIGAVGYQGFGARWPVRMVADYVKNLGAATDDDTGFGVDVLVGRASQQDDWRVGYGYAQADVDAVLAAFSHDNTNLSTNYRQHSLTFDYVTARNVILNATWYVYRPEDALHAGSNDPDDWLQRVRLNMLVNF